MIESQNKQKKAKMQIEAIYNMAQAKQIAEHISALFEPDKSKVKITPLSTYFPSLFSDVETTDDEQQIKKDLALNKAKMEEFAYWHNKKRKEKGR